MTAPTPEQLAAWRADVEREVATLRAEAAVALVGQLRELPEAVHDIAIDAVAAALDAREVAIRAQAPPWAAQGNAMGKTSDVLRRLHAFRKMLAGPPPGVDEVARLIREIAEAVPDHVADADWRLEDDGDRQRVVSDRRYAPARRVVHAGSQGVGKTFPVRGSFTAPVREVAVGGICPTCHNSGWLPRRQRCPRCRGRS